MNFARFDRAFRILHWSHAFLFIWLLITGIQLFLTQKSLLGDPFIKMIHLYAAPFLILIPGFIIMFGSMSSRYDVMDLMSWTEDDVRWFTRFLKTRKNIADGKFNGGQKVNFLVTALLILGLSFSGYVVWMKSMFSVEFVQVNFLVHDALAIAAIVLLTGHISFSFYYRESLRGILYGAVKRGWAQEHYPEWYEKSKGK